jgi:hypothetical protein
MTARLTKQVFYTAKLFQPSLMFTNTLSMGWLLRYFTKISCKHSSLFCHNVSDEENVYNIECEAQLYKSYKLR